MDPHRLAEERSLAYHRAVLERLDAETQSRERILECARQHVRAMLADGRSVHYAHAWEVLLSGPLDALRSILVADTEHARALRQSTPFAGAIPARERWAIWRSVRAASFGAHSPARSA